jgi:hypothetical protein
VIAGFAGTEVAATNDTFPHLDIIQKGCKYSVVVRNSQIVCEDVAFMLYVTAVRCSIAPIFRRGYLSAQTGRCTIGKVLIVIGFSSAGSLLHCKYGLLRVPFAVNHLVSSALHSYDSTLLPFAEDE